MRKVTASRMREIYAQTVLTFRITCVFRFLATFALGGLYQQWRHPTAARIRGLRVNQEY